MSQNLNNSEYPESLSYIQGIIHNDETICNTCGIKGKDNKLCGKCKYVRYCSKSCQINDWKLHKFQCLTISNNTKDISYILPQSASNITDISHVLPESAPNNKEHIGMTKLYVVEFYDISTGDDYKRPHKTDEGQIVKFYYEKNNAVLRMNMLQYIDQDPLEWRITEEWYNNDSFEVKYLKNGKNYITNIINNSIYYVSSINEKLKSQQPNMTKLYCMSFKDNGPYIFKPDSPNYMLTVKYITGVKRKNYIPVEVMWYPNDSKEVKYHAR